MTFWPACGADKSISSLSNLPHPSQWVHNDSMYVRLGGIRNTKTWSKSRFLVDITRKIMMDSDL